MREFILRAAKANTSPLFNVEELTRAGRMDVVARCVSNALWVSMNVRKDTLFHAVLEGPNLAPKTVSFYGESLEGADYDEKSIALLIQRALKKGISLKQNEEKDVMPGIKVSKKSFERLVEEKAAEAKNDDDIQLIYLHKEGKDAREFNFKEHPIFIFGDLSGMPAKTEGLLDRYGAEKISLGPVMLFAAACITIVHNEMDRRR
jgi:tRNA (pseudouridine54-N1)-methyltransferase